MEGPLISVIVSIYSTDRYTGLCIESIINQTYKNLEIILIDDGSIDRCPELCDLYASKDPRITVIHKKNGGLVSGRKAGMVAAKGEYVGYVDGDDWIEKDYFSAVYEEIKKNHPDVIVSSWTRALFDQHVVIHNNIEDGYYTGEKLEALKSKMISMGPFYKPGVSTYVWNKIFRRDLVFDCQMNVNEQLMTGEDACVSYAAIMKSNSVSIIRNASYYYRQHEDSMLKRKGNYPLEMKRMRILYDHLMSLSGENDVYKAQIVDYVLSSCIVRAGGLYPGADRFIFDDVFQDKRIVVYGAGSFGQLFMSKLMEKNVCTIVGWLDDDFWEYRRSCLNVDPVECVTQFDFDYLIITSIDGMVAEDFRNRFVSLGVNGNKIIKINIPEEKRKALLNEYLRGGIAE